MFLIQNYFNGQFVPPLTSRYLDNIEPATDQANGQIPDHSPEDVAALPAGPTPKARRTASPSAWRR